MQTVFRSRFEPAAARVQILPHGIGCQLAPQDQQDAQFIGEGTARLREGLSLILRNAAPVKSGLNAAILRRVLHLDEGVQHRHGAARGQAVPGRAGAAHFAGLCRVWPSSRGQPAHTVHIGLPGNVRHQRIAVDCAARRGSCRLGFVPGARMQGHDAPTPKQRGPEWFEVKPTETTASRGCANSPILESVNREGLTTTPCVERQESS